MVGEKLFDIGFSENPHQRGIEFLIAEMRACQFRVLWIAWLICSFSVLKGFGRANNMANHGRKLVRQHEFPYIAAQAS